MTDKRLLQEVMNGSMSDKDGRIKDDQYIYMVLEYGEIDLAHMLAHKWKELDSSDTTIDENWLRFYWQVHFSLFYLKILIRLKFIYSLHHLSSIISEIYFSCYCSKYSKL